MASSDSKVVVTFTLMPEAVSVNLLSQVFGENCCVHLHVVLDHGESYVSGTKIFCRVVVSANRLLSGPKSAGKSCLNSRRCRGSTQSIEHINAQDLQ